MRKQKLANGNYGEYKWKSYDEIYALATYVARGMEKLGLAAQQEYEGSTLRLVGIYSKNREEWIITDVACWMMSVTNVPLYDTLGEESICWTFEQTMLSTIFMTAIGIPKLVAIKKKGGIPTLTTAVTFDEVDPETKAKAAEVGIKIIPFAEIIQIGKAETSIPLRPCGPNTLITICYTSGTTDKAKGVEITHKNYRDSAAASLYSGIIVGWTPGYTLLSYLPLAHVFERVLVYISMLGGFQVAFFHGDIMQLKDDIVAARPDVLVGVPRIFGRFYDGIMSGINALTGFKKKLAQKALKSKTETFRKTGKMTHWFYDKFVFSKVRSSLGGKLKVFVSAAAPLDSSIMESMRVMCSAHFLQGYGQTETSGPVSISYFDDTYPASSGPPLACCLAKVVDVPEMEYKSTDVIDGVPTPRGELCIKGSHLTKGYFKDPEKTAQLYDKDGWMHTGDIALITPGGAIRIIDRKKNMFKLQHGEYVAPEKIENILVNNKWVLQIFVHGDSYQTYLIAIVVPKKEAVLEWAKEKGVTGTFEELCENSKELKEQILKDLTALSREKKVSVF